VKIGNLGTKKRRLKGEWEKNRKNKTINGRKKEAIPKTEGCKMQLLGSNIKVATCLQLNRATRKQINCKSIMKPIIKEMERRPE
jgi:hypothetical protein